MPARPPKTAGNAAPHGRAPSRRAGGTRISLGGAARLPPALAPRKRPAQHRARTTVEAILEAAVELFAARGYARTTTNAVAARAGISVGSLYQYFPNKDAILAALVERHMDAVDGVIRASLDDLADPSRPLGGSIRRMLERLLESHERAPGLSRAVEALVGQRPRIPEAFRERERAYRAQLERILRTRRDVRQGDHGVMAVLLFEIAETASAWLAHGGFSGEARRVAIDEATTAICGYIEARPSDPA
jgi:AcrR family transcriptional regulator